MCALRQKVLLPKSLRDFKVPFLTIRLVPLYSTSLLL